VVVDVGRGADDVGHVAGRAAPDGLEDVEDPDPAGDQ
jgi:hypothetical protein